MARVRARVMVKVTLRIVHSYVGKMHEVPFVWIQLLMDCEAS